MCAFASISGFDSEIATSPVAVNVPVPATLTIPASTDVPSSSTLPIERASPIELEAAGITLGVDYPAPIVDHSVERDESLARLAEIKKA